MEEEKKKKKIKDFAHLDPTQIQQSSDYVSKLILT